MSESEDIDMLAAEYALGTLPASERASIALRARSEPSGKACLKAPRTDAEFVFSANEQTPLVEPDGIEPTTSCLQSRRSPN